MDEKDQNVSGDFANIKQNAKKTVSRNTTKQAGTEGGKVLNYWRSLAMVLWYILLKKLAKKKKTLVAMELSHTPLAHLP